MEQVKRLWWRGRWAAAAGAFLSAALACCAPAVSDGSAAPGPQRRREAQRGGVARR